MALANTYQWSTTLQRNWNFRLTLKRGSNDLFLFTRHTTTRHYMQGKQRYMKILAESKIKPLENVYSGFARLKSVDPHQCVFLEITKSNPWIIYNISKGIITKNQYIFYSILILLIITFCMATFHQMWKVAEKGPKNLPTKTTFQLFNLLWNIFSGIFWKKPFQELG